MYHRILPKEDIRYSLEQPGMLVEPRTFQSHLEFIQKYFNVTRISDWINNSSEQRSTGISCAITFDDGWSDNYEYAFPLLKVMKMPASIFLVSDYVDTDRVFWPERLIYLISMTVAKDDILFLNTMEWEWLYKLYPKRHITKNDLNIETLDRIISLCKQIDDKSLNKYLDLIQEKHNHVIEAEKNDILNWEQIINMESSGLIDFGSHTRTHFRMNKLQSRTALEDEILQSKNIIEQHIQTPVKLFCYPNGDITKEADQLVRDSYLGALTTQSGINSPRDDQYQVKRISIHQDATSDEISFFATIARQIYASKV
jgi:peptidoglycan/xylan/chitin deacetylase (PgdA/CDA1 family)